MEKNARVSARSQKLGSRFHISLKKSNNWTKRSRIIFCHCLSGAKFKVLIILKHCLGDSPTKNCNLVMFGGEIKFAEKPKFGRISFLWTRLLLIFLTFFLKISKKIVSQEFFLTQNKDFEIILFHFYFSLKNVIIKAESGKWRVPSLKVKIIVGDFFSKSVFKMQRELFVVAAWELLNSFSQSIRSNGRNF